LSQLHELFIGVVLGIVEGLTEFIPVSSTGHLIVVGHWLGFSGERATTFDIFIQLGAMLAVVIRYRQRFVDLLPTSLHSEGLSGFRGLGLVALTTLPAVLVGVVTYGWIKGHLFTPLTVAVGLIAGGIAILLLEGRLPAYKRADLDSLTWREALGIGMFQCLALWPGVSRSAATILGGMLCGVERKTAAEYSFLIAVPALVGAAGFDLVQSIGSLNSSDLPLFTTGFVISFVAAWLAIHLFLRVLAVYTLRPFGWYRIAAACVVVLNR